MAEETQNEEQTTFKIADRRKFNLDGSLREGVTIEETTPKTEANAAASSVSAATAEAGSASAAPVEARQSLGATSAENSPADFSSNAENEAVNEAPVEDEDLIDESQIPGADNPASFANFILSLASQAAAALGLSQNPMTGQRSVDLESSRYLLDVLGMLREKTTGNLHPQEQKLFDGLLSDLRMQYVQMTRAAEAQLKKQAAQKFSGKDILGR